MGILRYFLVQGMIAALLCEPFPLWYAATHQRELTDKPLVVLQGRKILHASGVARRFGITQGMSLSAARAKADLVIVDLPPPTLEHSWSGILNELYAYTNQIESSHLGVAYLDVTPGAGTALAAVFRARVAFASSRSRARLFAYGTKEGRARIVGEDDELNLLRQVPTAYLKTFGLTRRDLERLDYLGVTRVGHLLSWSRNQLKNYFKKKAKPLEDLLFRSRALPLSVFTPAKTLNVSFTFDAGTNEPYRTVPVLQKLCEELVAGLGRKSARQLTLCARVQQTTFKASKLAKQPTQNVDTLVRLALRCLEESMVGDLLIDELELELSQLILVSEQTGLWQQRRNIAHALEVVNERYPHKLVTVETLNPYSLAAEHQYRIPKGQESSPQPNTQHAARQERLLL